MRLAPVLLNFPLSAFCALGRAASVVALWGLATACLAEPQPPIPPDVADLGLQPQCQAISDDSFAKKLQESEIVTMQEQLILLGYNPEWIDGIFGPRTRAALEKFCSRAKFATSPDVLAMLRNHLAIYQVYPNWAETLDSPAFAEWEKLQRDAREIGATRASGDAQKVIALLERYHKAERDQAMQQRSQGSEPPPRKQAPDGAQLSYMLSAQDFELLQGRTAALAQVRQLQGKIFPAQQDLETAIEATLKGVPEPDKIRTLAVNNIQRLVMYRLSSESFNRLKVANVPVWVLQALQGLRDVNYLREPMNDAVSNALAAVADKVAHLDVQTIVALADVSASGVVTLTADSLSKFAAAHKDDPAAAAMLGKLQKAQGVQYQSAKYMTAAMMNLRQQAAAEVPGYQSLIVASALETDVYSLKDAFMKEFENATSAYTLPDEYLGMLGELKGVEYPNAEVFWTATKAKVEMAGPHNSVIKALSQTIHARATAAPNSVLVVDDALLDGLRANRVPSAVVSLVAELKGIPYENEEALDKAVNSKIELNVEKLDNGYDRYHSLLVSLAMKRHPFGNVKVEWSGESCNCVQSNLVGEVYGFYPYWMAGQKENIDFSVRTRLGFYALGIDDAGSILNAPVWSGIDSGFIKEARRYGTKVDLVLHKDDWDTWGKLDRADKNASLDNLAAGIIRMLSVSLDGSPEESPLLSHGRGDGITLYFEHYPRDPESVNSFTAFITGLGSKLKALGGGYTLSLMFDATEMGDGIYEYGELLQHLRQAKKDYGLLFVVVLPEPTTNYKKLLRLEIENGGIHGQDRIDLLRHVVTVVTYDRHTEEQLRDDVVYARDNFGGIGFWPDIPLAASGAAGATVSTILHDDYLNKREGGTPGVCKYICPNKWAFRLTWGLFLVILLASAPLYVAVCSWRNFFNDNFPYFVAGAVIPFVVLTFALLLCDPAWARISKGNLPLFLVILAAIAYSIWNYHYQKSKADLP